MPYGRSWTVSAKAHPGSAAHDVADEPDGESGHHHRIGFRNREDRYPGFTSERDEYQHEIEQAVKDRKDLEDRTSKGQLVNFRDVIQRQPDFHLRHPQNRSLGWRYVLDFTEDWVKYTQSWPIDATKRKSAVQSERGNQHSDDGEPHKKPHDKPGNDSPEDSLQKDQTPRGENAENDETPDEDGRSQQEMAIVRALKEEKAYFSTLTCNDGKGKSPQTRNRTHIST